jgi:hypothetical protein
VLAEFGGDSTRYTTAKTRTLYDETTAWSHHAALAAAA